MSYSRRYSTSSSATATSTYPYRQSFVEVRNGHEYMTMLPPMTTEEDLLQEGVLDDPEIYGLPRAQRLQELVRKLRQRLKRRGNRRD
ncbi:hypothetical protein C8Q78DRAFT_1077768 [Trametes maxima]|nr:hypothetical protein C8Q78DRAFT_1077768 [Trametes maxima]